MERGHALPREYGQWLGGVLADPPSFSQYRRNAAQRDGALRLEIAVRSHLAENPGAKLDEAFDRVAATHHKSHATVRKRYAESGKPRGSLKDRASNPPP